MNTVVSTVPPPLRYGLLDLNRNQQRSPLLGIRQRAQGMALREKSIWQAVTAWKERWKDWVCWKGAVSYPSLENLQNISVPGKYWSHYLRYLKYLDGLRDLPIVTRSDWDLVVLLDFIIRYIFIYLMIIIFVIRYYYLLITRHYAKCFIYVILSSLLSTLWIMYYHYLHFLQIGKVKYSAKCHTTSKWENGRSNPGHQKPKFTIYTTHRLHFNTLGSMTYPFLGNRLTDLWRCITPNSRSWHQIQDHFLPEEKPAAALDWVFCPRNAGMAAAEQWNRRSARTLASRHRAECDGQRGAVTLWWWSWASDRFLTWVCNRLLGL